MASSRPIVVMRDLASFTIWRKPFFTFMAKRHLRAPLLERV